MIRPPGFAGAAFGAATDGNARTSADARRDISRSLGISPDWAFVRQVHGPDVMSAEGPGNLGEADAIVTAVPGLPVAISTADCVPVIVEAPRAAAVIHAGWRSLAAGVVEATLARLGEAGHAPTRAAIGPAIGPCCYEVGGKVLGAFAGFGAVTTWGTASVDLPAAAAAALGPIEIWRLEACTRDDGGFHSHRRDQTKRRQVTVAWVPPG